MIYIIVVVFVINNTPGSETLKFYAREALRFLRKLHLSKEWESISQKQRTLEKCVALILQWCKPNADLSWKKFANKIDKKAEEVGFYFCLILKRQ